MDISDTLSYMRDRQVGTTMIIDAPANDPVLLQAAGDGFVDRVGDQWVARGYIQSGERRVVRHTYGPVSIVVGKE